MARRLVVLAAKAKAPAGKGFGAAPKGGNKGIALEAPCPCGSGAAYEVRRAANAIASQVAY